jgi:hypothetical protein
VPTGEQAAEPQAGAADENEGQPEDSGEQPASEAESASKARE